MSHTPGPWTIRRVHEGYEIESDAGPATTAPDLLETVQRIARSVHDAFHVGATFEACTENTCDAVRKAVAKAKGKS